MEHVSPKAREALQRAEIVIGYKTYLELIGELLAELAGKFPKGKKIISAGMRDEIKRVNRALDEAMTGQKVAIVSGGDSGIYGMAGLVLEVAAQRNMNIAWLKDKKKENYDVLVEVIPGIPALTAAASLLGAPLMHDFASVSLSDLLTPWEVIQNRIENAAGGDFVIIIYNPKSKKRNWQLSSAKEIILKYRKPGTPVGIVRSAMREGQKMTISTLSNMDRCDVDMQTIIIVGNSATVQHGDFMITPRGYLVPERKPMVASRHCEE
jgi:precorrin-3B C17-methyltransferase